MIGKKENLSSPSGSFDFEGSYDLLEDEMLRGLAKKQESDSKERSRQAPMGEDLAGMGDSLEFETSDDINKIIQRYENMLSQG